MSVCSHGRLSSHHRGGVWDEDHGGSRSEGEAADLGHSRSGAVQGRHQVLLQRGRRGPDGLRHHQVLRWCLKPEPAAVCENVMWYRETTDVSGCWGCSVIFILTWSFRVDRHKNDTTFTITLMCVCVGEVLTTTWAAGWQMPETWPTQTQWVFN